jgi:hypothetical protein
MSMSLSLALPIAARPHSIYRLQPSL